MFYWYSEVHVITSVWHHCVNIRHLECRNFLNENQMRGLFLNKNDCTSLMGCEIRNLRVHFCTSLFFLNLL